MQRADQVQRDRRGPVQPPGDTVRGQELPRIGDVRRDVVRPVVLREQGTPMHDGHRIVVDVNDGRVPVAPLRDLVRVLQRRQPRPAVQELVDPDGASQVSGDPQQESPIVGGQRAQFRDESGQLVAHRPVGRVVVLAAEERVVNPRAGRPRGVDAAGRARASSAGWCHVAPNPIAAPIR